MHKVRGGKLSLCRSLGADLERESSSSIILLYFSLFLMAHGKLAMVGPTGGSGEEIEKKRKEKKRKDYSGYEYLTLLYYFCFVAERRDGRYLKG